MTDIASSTWQRASEPAESVPLPHPVPFGAPVFIGDCVTPLAGETVLALLWRRLERGRDG